MTTSQICTSGFKIESIREEIQGKKKPFNKMRNQLSEKGRGEQKGLANNRIKAILKFLYETAPNSFQVSVSKCPFKISPTAKIEFCHFIVVTVGLLIS